jgi:hypothetical protein
MPAPDQLDPTDRHAEGSAALGLTHYLPQTPNTLFSNLSC